MAESTDSRDSPAKLWGGRFQGGVDPRIDRFTAALGFDRRLLRHDLIASLAHARMLFDRSVLGREDAQAILDGLSGLLSAAERGALEVAGPDEDVHSWIERRLYERIGDPALRVHTARSRNDQTAIALRLYVREALRDLVRGAVAFGAALVEAASSHLETWLPGYTHLQRGQPVSLAHHLLAHFWALEADARRIAALHDGGFRSPLGAGALAGSPYPIDPERSAALLGLPGAYPNSMLAVADRDYVAEAAFASALVMSHLARWASEVVLWTSSEFGFAVLDDSVAKGSSLMPQKRNPEPAEILRGKSARVAGDAGAILMLLHGLPLTYNSDLQEDKETLFDALDTTTAALEVAPAILEGLRFRPERMRAALEGGFLTATDLADYLVAKGVPFRSAHHHAGQAVVAAERLGVELVALPLEELRAVWPGVEPDVYEWLRPDSAVRRRAHAGAPAPERVREQLAQARAATARHQRWLEEASTLPPIVRAHREGRLLAETLP
ncbi:MAG TPA: argininosuccinate lyase [Thermoanaerobaculia bacterium]|nr:argininosuccinate lyase [Thermoanaerobaculia bacterium]